MHVASAAVAALRRRLSPGALLILPQGPPSAAEGARFDEHIAGILARSGRFAMTWGIIMLFLWWPTDLLVFHRLPEAIGPFFRLRVVMLVSCVVVLLYLRRRAVVTPAAQLPPVALWGFSCGVISYCLGTLGGLDRPWFHFTYLLLCIPVAFPVGLGRRVAYTAWIALCLGVGYCVAAPESLRSPYLLATGGFVLFICLCGVLYGHLFFGLTRSNFFQAQALASYNERLSTEVDQRTCELRQLSQHLVHLLEDERARISRELHDELGQQLTAMRYELAFLRQRFALDPASVRGNLESLDLLMTHTTAAARQIVTDLRPRLLDDRGLPSAVEWLVQRTQEHTDLACELLMEGSPPAELGDELRTAVFRILQESLTNVARHAQARRAEVRLRFLRDRVELEVRDDGVGVSASAPASAAGGMGSVGMRERARALGGTLAIRRRPEGGTEVRCLLPLRAQGEVIR